MNIADIQRGPKRDFIKYNLTAPKKKQRYIKYIGIHYHTKVQIKIIQSKEPRRQSGKQLRDSGGHLYLISISTNVCHHGKYVTNFPNYNDHITL